MGRQSQDGTNQMKRKPTKIAATSPSQSLPSAALLDDVRALIQEAREQVAQTVNVGLTLLYWQVGNRIRREILKEKRAEYGESIVHALSAQLAAEFGRGFSEKSLRRMIQFADVFPDREIVVSLLRQLSWTHFLRLIPINDPLKRDFYTEMCRVERWSTRTLEKKIASMLFERTALSRKPAKLAETELKQLREEDRLTPDLVFRDPYLLDFLGLKDTYSEKDLENAILREIEAFILELGVGFAFLERQKRISIDEDDYYLDLLFYHRQLQRLVAIELKLQDFKPADMGQMELYLRWLDRHERREGEESPIGLILCAGKKRETIELLDLGSRGIRVASYWTEALPKAQLEQKLHDAIRHARAQLERRSEQLNSGASTAPDALPRSSNKRQMKKP